MPAAAPGYVKNMIRRSLREIVDPSPTNKEKHLIWKYFDSECAFCGQSLSREKKEGHIDHLVSASVGGPNNISNRILSCARCNEKEKRDTDWEDFLTRKNSNQVLLQKRRDKILGWMKLHQNPTLKQQTIDAVAALGNEVCLFYDAKVNETRNLGKEKS